MNALSKEISRQVRLGAAGMCPHPPTPTHHPPKATIVRQRNAFQKVAPFTMKDVGYRPIFHLSLKGEFLLPENRAAMFLVLCKSFGFFVCF